MKAGSLHTKTESGLRRMAKDGNGMLLDKNEMQDWKKLLHQENSHEGDLCDHHSRIKMPVESPNESMCKRLKGIRNGEERKKMEPAQPAKQSNRGGRQSFYV